MKNDTGSDLLDGFLHSYGEKETAGAAKDNDLATIDLIVFLIVLTTIALVFFLPYH